MNRAMNFSPGPAALPFEALQQAQAELLDFNGSGMSVMEQSHRGAVYEAVHNEAIGLLRDLLELSPDYDVLLLQGGASHQFAMVPLNFMREDLAAAHVVTGAWSEKAASEARLASRWVGGQVAILFDGADERFGAPYTRLPESIAVDPSFAYLQFTSNETIHGVQFGVDKPASFLGTADVPVICDMSSDFLWRPMDVTPYSLIYAGAQKNLGPSGVTIVIARRDFIEQGRSGLPNILTYKAHAAANSLLNTPSTFGIYLVRNVLRWLKDEGGPRTMERRNRAKAAHIYGAIDASPEMFRCPIERSARSMMNVVFHLPSPALEEGFLEEAKKSRMIGLAGHRSVGGIRVSLYNAIPVAWADELGKLMRDFAARKG